MVSLGCTKNQVDAERMLYSIREAGYQLVSDAALADIAVINTCGFIESAKQEAIDTILEFATLKKEGRIKKIVITGCLAERYREEVAELIPEADAVVGIGCNSDIVSILEKIMAMSAYRLSETRKISLLPGTGCRPRFRFPHTLRSPRAVTTAVPTARYRTYADVSAAFPWTSLSRKPNALSATG